MKERTMNGMPIREIWAKLKEDFPPEVVEIHPSTGIPFIPVEAIERRLNEVVGIENWDFFVDSSQVCRFGTEGRESCVVSGRLVLYDDGRVPVVRSTCGAANCIYPKDGNFPTSVANAVDSAVQDAFKRCAKRFGIARLEQKENKRGRRESQTDERHMKVVILEPFKALPRGGAKAKVSLDGETFELVIWQNQWVALQKRYADRFRIGGKLNEMSFVGVFRDYHGTEQIEFVRLPERTAAKAGAA